MFKSNNILISIFYFANFICTFIKTSSIQFLEALVLCSLIVFHFLG